MTTTERKYTDDEAGDLADAIYERDILPKVVGEHCGDYLALDFETGQYEIDADDAEALRRISAYSSPEALMIYRIGFPAAAKIGGRWTPRKPMREITL